MSVTGFDIYKTYLAFKLHFSNQKFDFFECGGKGKAKEKTYQDRKDFWFFETLSRKLNDNEVNEYMLASFISSDAPSKIWIGDIKTNGKENWLRWQGRMSRLPYIFTQEVEKLTSHYSYNELFDTRNGHPPLLKAFIRNEVCIETLIILDIITNFMLYWDKHLTDVLWQDIAFKIRKYKPFLSINKDKYKKMLQNIILS